MEETVPTRPIVRGERVWLRPIEERDLGAYGDAVNEHDPGWLAGYRRPVSMADVKKWFEGISARQGDDGYWFTICELGSRDFVGQLWLWNIDHRVPGAEISIFVTKPGGGVGSDAINAAVDFGFASVGVTRIWGFTEATNDRSLTTFNRCGFVTEGRMRGASRSLGKPGDMIQFSMTIDDWRALERSRSWDWNDQS